MYIAGTYIALQMSSVLWSIINTLVIFLSILLLHQSYAIIIVSLLTPMTLPV